MMIDMKMEQGIQSNCSESVYMLSKKDFKKHFIALKSIITSEWGSFEPVEGYSSLRPTKDDICIYFYQTFGGGVLQYLEENKILYDTEQWLTFFYDNKELVEKFDKIGQTTGQVGGGGEIFRRKPYEYDKV